MNYNHDYQKNVTVLKPSIGEEHIRKATSILSEYKKGKTNLETKIVDNEQWFKMRHWECMRKQKGEEIEPTSGWLFNCIANKHADAMDNIPAPIILPREAGDQQEAKQLSSIVPVILDQNDFEKVYSDVCYYKLKNGTGVYGIFWDSLKYNGKGDIAIKKVDLLNLFWESGITDIQKSKNLFYVDLCDNETLVSMYPQLENKPSGENVEISKYVYDDTVDTTNKSAVVDWYYKKHNSNGKVVLHYCKYCGDTVLYSSENDPDYSERGFYDHGKYPFVFDVLYPVEGTPSGFGYIDIGKDAQSFIDRLNQAISKNALMSTSPRYFVDSSGAINEAEFADLSKPFVHVAGSNFGKDSIVPITTSGLGSIYVSVLNNKIEELKEVTGNRDVTTGGTTSGVTAASAIAAMQEASSKLSRDSNKQTYRAFKEVTLYIIELIRQFYDLPRCFRITGQNGLNEFIEYSNSNIQPQNQNIEMGVDMGYRIPLFDVEVAAQKQSPYSKLSQNELALQFYGAGFFNPQISDQALACIEMMDFDRKDFVMQKIAENGTMYIALLMILALFVHI